MKVKSIELNTNEIITDGDFISIDNYIIIDASGLIIWNGEKIELPFKHSLDFPRIKLLANGKFIFIDGARNENVKNAWIINQNLEVEKSLILGTVQNIIFSENYLLCSYSHTDTSNLGNTGLTVFNQDSKQLFSYYKNDYKEKELQWFEVYSFLKEEDQKIFYMIYPTFSIVEFDKEFKSKIICEIPNEEIIKRDDFWNPKAFTRKGDDWYFITPDRKNKISRIFKMHVNKKIECIGTCGFSFTPKGLENGRFFVPIQNPIQRKGKFEIIEV